MVLAAVFIVPLWMIAKKRSGLTRELRPNAATIKKKTWVSRLLRPDTFSVKRPKPYAEEAFDKEEITSLSWSPNGKKLAVGTRRSVLAFNTETDWGNIEIWDVKKQKMLDFLGDHGVEVYSVVWSPDGRRLAAYSGDFIPSSVSLWNLEPQSAHTPKVLSQSWTREPSSQMAGLCFSQDGRTLSVLRSDRSNSLTSHAKSNWTLAKHNTLMGQEEGVRPLGKREPQSQIAFDANSFDRMKRAAIADGGNTLAFVAEDGVSKFDTLFIHSIATSHVVTLPLPHSDLTQLCLSADGSTLALKVDTDSVTILNTAKGTERYRIETPHINAFALSPDGRRAATVDSGTELSLWDTSASTGTRLGTMTKAIESTSPNGVNTAASIQLQFSPDSSTLAVALQDGTVTLWRVRQK